MSESTFPGLTLCRHLHVISLSSGAQALIATRPGLSSSTRMSGAYVLDRPGELQAMRGCLCGSSVGCGPLHFGFHAK